MGQAKPRTPTIEWVKGSSWTDFILKGRDDPSEALNCERFLADLNGLRDWPPQSTVKGRHGLLFRPPTVVTNETGLRRVGVTAAAGVDWSKPTVVLMNGQLRLYVDEWLETGRSRDGVEDPRQRDLTKAPNARWAVTSFSEKERFKLDPVRDGLQLRLPSGEPHDPLDRANRLFSLLFLCDWRLKLAKCARCGSYFELKHWKRVYKRGTFCPECTRARSLDSAVVHTAKIRKATEQGLYRLVAKRFSKRIARTQNWNRDLELRAEVIEFLNAEIQKSDGLRSVHPGGITVKWLSWSKNRQGIEKAVRERANAKS